MNDRTYAPPEARAWPESTRGVTTLEACRRCERGFRPRDLSADGFCEECAARNRAEDAYAARFRR